MNSMKRILLIFCSGLFGIQTVSAQDVQIKITGTIYIPPCKINNDNDFKIPFGKIPLQKIDGVNFAKSTTVTVNCEYFQGKPYVYLSRGTGLLLGAPDYVLKTTGANPSTLGIALYQGNSVDSAYPLRIGAGVYGKNGNEIKKGFSSLNTQISEFTFTAVPYKYGSENLNAGEFEASVTMSISYL